MKRLLVAALAATVLVPVASAASSPTHTLRGTVVAKDRAHHGLVVALPGGRVQTLVAPQAFARTDVGRKVVLRFTPVAGRLSVATGVSVVGSTRHAVVRGTIVRLVRRHAVVNAGGSAFHVTLRPSTGKRVLALSSSGPGVGDTVEIEVSIAGDGSLAGTATVVPAAQSAASEGEMEVRGKVKGPLSATSITVTTGSGVDVTCGIPAGVTAMVAVDALIELKCELVGGAWVLKVAHGEEDDDAGPATDAGRVVVQGTITGELTTTSTAVTVTPDAGTPVTCAIKPGTLNGFSSGDAVRMTCIKVADALTLKEIEKRSSGQQGDDHSGSQGSDDQGDGENED
jgi:hypothetical protein